MSLRSISFHRTTCPHTEHAEVLQPEKQHPLAACKLLLLLGEWAHSTFGQAGNFGALSASQAEKALSYKSRAPIIPSSAFHAPKHSASPKFKVLNTRCPRDGPAKPAGTSVQKTHLRREKKQQVNCRVLHSPYILSNSFAQGCTVRSPPCGHWKEGVSQQLGEKSELILGDDRQVVNLIRDRRREEGARKRSKQKGRRREGAI